MRNLKRVLSLVMMIALLAGLMVIGASAGYNDFTDKDKITHKTAVQTLVELNIIAGKEDGSYYDPQGILTRAEAAKLVTVVLNGGKAPVLGNPDYVSYKDTKDNWASAYIEFVTAKGIVAGDGQGNFLPNKTVTGSELAKMLLVAIGYDAKFEGLVGNSWAAKTDVLANQNGLYDGLDNLVTSDGLNRDDAAQIIYNVLTTHLVRYQSAGEDGAVGTVADKINATVLSRYFNTSEVVGIIEANDVFSIKKDGDEAASGKITLAVSEVNDVKDESDIPLTLKVDVSNDMVGKEVTVFVKNMGKTNEAIIGNVIPTENNNEISTMDSFKKYDDADDWMKDNGMKIANDAILVYNGVYDDAADIDDLYCSDCGLAGVERRLLDNDGDNKADIVFMVWKDLTQVKKIDTKNEKITFTSGTYDEEDVVAYKGMAKDDYVLFVEFGASDTVYVEKAATVEGKVNAANFNMANWKVTVTIDNKKYQLSAVDNETDLNDVNPGTIELTKSYVFYLDNAGNLIAVDDPIDGSKDYAYVVATDINSKLGSYTGSIKLVLADGSEVVYDVNLAASANKFDISGSTKDKEAMMAKRLGDLKGTIVTYTVNDSKEVVIDDPHQTTNIASYETAIRSNPGYDARIDGSTKMILANNSTVYFCVDGDDVTVVKGIKALPTSDGNDITRVAYTEKDGKYTAEAAVVDGSMKGDSSYAYLLPDVQVTDNDGSYLFTYEYVTADSATIKTVSSEDPTRVPGLWKMTADGDYFIFDTDDDMYLNQEITQVDSDGTMIVGGRSRNVADDVKIMDVTDTDAPAAATIADLEKGNIVSFVLDDDGLISQLFIVAEDSDAPIPTYPM